MDTNVILYLDTNVIWIPIHNGLKMFEKNEQQMIMINMHCKDKSTNKITDKSVASRF